MRDHYYTSYNVYHANSVKSPFLAVQVLFTRPLSRAGVGARGFLQKSVSALKPLFRRCILPTLQCRITAHTPDPYLIYPRSSSRDRHESQNGRIGALRSVQVRFLNTSRVDNLTLSRVSLLSGRKSLQLITLGASLFYVFQDFINVYYQKKHTRHFFTVNIERYSIRENYSKFTILAYSISPASLRAGIVPLFKAGGMRLAA